MSIAMTQIVDSLAMISPRPNRFARPPAMFADKNVFIGAHDLDQGAVG
jgi:hypothetical protein